MFPWKNLESKWKVPVFLKVASALMSALDHTSSELHIQFFWTFLHQCWAHFKCLEGFANRGTFRNLNRNCKEDTASTRCDWQDAVSVIQYLIFRSNFRLRQYFVWASHIVPIFLLPPTETQTVGTVPGTTAKSPKTDFLHKHSNLVCTTNLGVNNTILVFN